MQGVAAKDDASYDLSVRRSLGRRSSRASFAGAGGRRTFAIPHPARRRQSSICSGERARLPTRYVHCRWHRRDARRGSARAARAARARRQRGLARAG